MNVIKFDFKLQANMPLNENYNINGNHHICLGLNYIQFKFEFNFVYV
jgi:hypothetical protein